MKNFYKRSIILLGILALPLATYGAIQIKSIKWTDYIAQIETQNQQNVFIYKVEDASNTCYVMTNDFSVNQRVNGANLGISCVNTPVVPVVKK